MTQHITLLDIAGLQQATCNDMQNFDKQQSVHGTEKNAEVMEKMIMIVLCAAGLEVLVICFPVQNMQAISNNSLLLTRLLCWWCMSSSQQVVSVRRG